MAVKRRRRNQDMVELLEVVEIQQLIVNKDGTTDAVVKDVEFSKLSQENPRRRKARKTKNAKLFAAARRMGQMAPPVKRSHRKKITAKNRRRR